ncbi:MAG: IS200/IS605 family transposase [Desulfobacteraceae bacterium]|nr:IS200/IS605 family transposase [Desulfobacteraceae bacterium]
MPLTRTIIEVAAFDIQINEMQVDQDHIHFIVESIPSLSPLQIVRKLKQESTFRIWKDHPELQKHFWKERTFWSDGYFCCSIGKASIDTVNKYIEIAQRRFIPKAKGLGVFSPHHFIKICCFKEKQLETCADCQSYPTCHLIQEFHGKSSYKYKKYKQSILFIRQKIKVVMIPNPF